MGRKKKVFDVGLGESKQYLRTPLSGSALRNARRGRNLSQADLGEKLGVSAATISLWEAGERRPSDELKRRLKEIFGIRTGNPERTSSLPKRRESDSQGVRQDHGSTDGARLRLARIQAGLSQLEVAEKVRVSQGTISNWENDRSSPDLGEANQLEKLLGFSTEDEQNREVDGPSPIGVWLNKKRNEVRLTVAQLAAKSGIKMPTIYAIESGKIANPRERTLRALEQALGAFVPEETQEEVNAQAQIEGLGELIDFDPHDENDWPSAAGIYVLYDVTERPVYVGEGQAIQKRLRDHQS
ncbi:MAG: helix-turn-helix domain-containing protein, partial [Candidatus Obscuribacterales bacterium]